MSSKRHGSVPKEPVYVHNIVAQHKGRNVPLIRQGTPIDDLAKAIQWHRHSRQLYVVDEQDQLLGNITLERLVMYVFASSHGSHMNPRHIMGLITCTYAEDLMTEGTLTAQMDDRIEEVLDRMVDAHVDEIPVIDENGKVIADLTMVDLLMAEE